MTNNAATIVISLSNLQKKFGGFTAVDNLSLDIHKGEILGFLGPNGAGKTTTINMICGLSSPSAGSIQFAEGIPKKNQKKRIGYCPQANIFWPKLTCLEQLGFMGKMYALNNKEAKQRASQLLQFMGLEAKANVFASKLSGGMKRRLNICLALIHDPEILVLDEPEAGLDPQSRILVRNFIKNLSREKTIILTTHNMDEADRLSDRVAIIDYGKLLKLDTPQKLKKSIGEGDILEIELENSNDKTAEAVIHNLNGIVDDLKLKEKTLLIRSKNLIEKVSQITNIIKNQAIEIKSITLRENTLEDVFIHLTGRRLRQ
ncbi:MAG: ABC transporter ATP-binding protein [Bacteroidetes bacterium]|nr:ABC transporter ATP-binding protein [Bacteroidota bacterium]